MNEWMNGWMNGWMNRWMNEWLNELVNDWLAKNNSFNRQLIESMNEQSSIWYFSTERNHVWAEELINEWGNINNILTFIWFKLGYSIPIYTN